MQRLCSSKTCTAPEGESTLPQKSLSCSAMALSMLGRILGRGREADEAKARANAIVSSLDDEGLRLRFRVRDV